jgi:hypothetical protein
LDTINWTGLIGSALWVLGLATCLAALSMAHYEARAGNDGLWGRLTQPRSQLALAAGATLFCAGLLLRSGTWCEKGIWGLCAVFFIVWAIRVSMRLGDAGVEGA